MHLIALVDGPRHVCCRYRLAAFRSHFARAGHTLDVQTLPRGWWSRLWHLRPLTGASVILQRRLLPPWEISRLRQRVKHLLFDFDDAVFLRDSFSPKGIHHPRRLQRFRATIAACDAVIAGNAYLAEQASAATGGRDCVHVIPTCVDPSGYSPRQQAPPPDRPLQLVWVGSSSTLQGLEAIAPLLDEIGRTFPGVQLKVICDRFPQFKDLAVMACPWDDATEAREIADGDIGISWVPDDQWSRGKCGLKVLQYMAAGLPVIANPVGVHAEMIRPGQNGYLATSTQEWLDAINRLAGDVALRHNLGHNGRARLETDYSVEAGATRWLAVLDRLERQSARAG